MGRIARGSIFAAVLTGAIVLAWPTVGLPWASLIVLGWVLWVADAMNAEHARAQDREGELLHRIDGKPLPEEARRFLEELDRSVQLPALERMEIRAELTDHLTDSVHAIAAEGLSEAAATREALARLGNPAELGSQLTRAHRTTRRLLAGAAGGVFQAGFGFAWGTLLGTLIVMLVLIVGAALAATVLWRPVEFLASLAPRLAAEPMDVSAGTTFGALVFSVAAFVGARNGIRTFARLSARPLRTSARLWAVAGCAALAGLLLFVIPVTQSWLAVAAEFLVPAAFVVGALARVDRDVVPRLPRPVAFGSFVALIVLPATIFVFGMAEGGGSRPSPMATSIDLHRWDRVAPAVAGPNNPAELVRVGGGSMPVAVIDQSYEIQDVAALSAYRDLRFELWRAVPAAGISKDLLEFDPDPAATAPFVVVPATLADGELHVRIDMSHVRPGPWLLFLVGVGSDGHRYRLEPIPDTEVNSFSGTVWDWLTAAD